MSTCEICVHHDGRGTVMSIAQWDKHGFLYHASSNQVDSPKHGLKAAELYRNLIKTYFKEVFITTNWNGS